MEFDEAQIESFMEMQENILWSDDFTRSWRTEKTVKQSYYENKKINEAIAKAQDGSNIQLTEEELNIPF